MITQSESIDILMVQSDCHQILFLTTHVVASFYITIRKNTLLDDALAGNNNEMLF